MSRKKESPFGQVIRERRRQLARRIKTSTPYIGHLEGGKRHPSERIVSRLAEVLGLERRELFLLAASWDIVSTAEGENVEIRREGDTVTRNLFCCSR